MKYEHRNFYNSLICVDESNQFNMVEECELVDDYITMDKYNCHCGNKHVHSKSSISFKESVKETLLFASDF